MDVAHLAVHIIVAIVITGCFLSVQLGLEPHTYNVMRCHPNAMTSYDDICRSMRSCIVRPTINALCYPLLLIAVSRKRAGHVCPRDSADVVNVNGEARLFSNCVSLSLLSSLKYSSTTQGSLPFQPSFYTFLTLYTYTWNHLILFFCVTTSKMETVHKVINTASNAIWGEGNTTAQEHDEPISGVQGKGSSTDPYDAGNREGKSIPYLQPAFMTANFIHIKTPPTLIMTTYHRPHSYLSAYIPIYIPPPAAFLPPAYFIWNNWKSTWLLGYGCSLQNQKPGKEKQSLTLPPKSQNNPKPQQQTPTPPRKIRS